MESKDTLLDQKANEMIQNLDTFLDKVKDHEEQYRLNPSVIWTNSLSGGSVYVGGEKSASNYEQLV